MNPLWPPLSITPLTGASGCYTPVHSPLPTLTETHKVPISNRLYLAANSSGTGAVAISAATSLTYRPVTSDGGKYLAFEIIPVDENSLAGTAVRSVFRLVNSAPVATNVNVYAPSAVPGQTIRGRFTYTDAEDNPRGNALYTWYRKNTAH